MQQSILPFCRQKIARHRPALRNVAYGFVIFVGLYGLYHMFIGGSTSLSSGYSTLDPNRVPSKVWKARAEEVKDAFKHAYHGYERHAAPSDELRPLTDGKLNNFNGWGVTAFDSLDTMLLLGLREEYDRALNIVKAANFSEAANGYVPYFETIIRYLGGLLSAYALSKDEILLGRAKELADMLDPIFKAPSGMPFYALSPTTGVVKGPGIGILAECASFQLEYTYLAKVTRNKKYINRVNTLNRMFSAANLTNTGGMLPVQWNMTSGEPYSNRLSVGAQADSTHEYLLKQYLLTAKTDKRSLEMYLRATTHIITNLMYLSPHRHLLYVTDSDTSTFGGLGDPSHTFEHLSCFLPGLLALGAHTLPLDNLKELGIDLNDLGDEARYGHAGKGYKLLSKYNLKKLHMWAAEGLAQTCWLTYADQPSGLGPDEIIIKVQLGPKTWDREGNRWFQKSDTYLWMDAVDTWRKSGGRGEVPGVSDQKAIIYTEEERSTGKARGRDYLLRRTGYLLRPETVESFYILWRVTGDAKWRARGWTIFEAIKRETRTESGFATVKVVDISPVPKGDSMPSFFLAETLKYLYLLFIEDDPLPLEQWVFNTEAHPLPVFEWTEEERAVFEV